MSFVICASLATVLAAYAPQAFLDYCLRITITSTKAIGLLLGLSVTSSADIMTVNGFAMRIISQCTALHYVIILSTAILLYTRHSLRYRMAGVVVSIFIVVAANAFRLIITGFIGSISWGAFVIAHDYFWVAALSLLILGIWIAWAGRRFTLTQEAAMRGSMIVFSCTAVYGVLLLAMPLYGGLMAQATSMLFKVLISDSTAGIIFDGDQMLYNYIGGTFSANFAPDLMVVALYIGLILSNGNLHRGALKRGITGLVVILSVSVIVIAGGGALAVLAGKDIAVLFLWTAHGLLLQFTLLWWICGGRLCWDRNSSSKCGG